ncbi:hypothetical protein HERIO_778 [Hepatospora eriocheir]|uniref:Uncharacterized protein n=1 Tax=Hepatospora eriocheir TaxID=1081669 RepID=A0A1X0QC64_9MICR|nr:hypothetical protein HERIO_778 [Hepatospora eriocheir]
MITKNSNNTSKSKEDEILRNYTDKKTYEVIQYLELVNKSKWTNIKMLILNFINKNKTVVTYDLYIKSILPLYKEKSFIIRKDKNSYGLANIDDI